MVLQDDDATENDLTVGLGTYMAFTDVPLKYVNVTGLSANTGGYETVDVKVNFPGGGYLKWAILALMLACGSGCESETFGAQRGLDDDLVILSLRILAVTLMVILVLAAFVFGYVEGQRSRDSAMSEALVRAQTAERMMGVFAVVVPQFEEQSAFAVAAYDRQREMIEAQTMEIQRNREILGEFVDLRTHSERVVHRALDEAEFHCDEECPMRCSVYLLPEDGLWHLYPRCGSPTSEMAERQPCPDCAQEWMTPYVPDRSGTSLSTDIQHYLEVSERTYALW